VNFHHKWIYKIRNILHRLREAIHGTENHNGWIRCKSVLTAIHHRDGKPYRDLGVISRRVVTNAGVAFMAAEFASAADIISKFKYHASGTGAVAENVTDTALGAEVGAARISGTNSNPTAPQYRTIGLCPYIAGFAITEHGIFSQLAAGGTLWDRSVFAAINVLNGDSIEFTYTLTIVAGG
jgi:hypothetical protein